jgi:aspartyl-tRNA(Asn)/glutamyl-tRNA(Gln) amidotransferase subunit B
MTIPFDAYESVIGFECHVQLNTCSKLFSSGPNKFGAAPNVLLDIVDAGLPGVLPSLNKQAVESAISLGLALNCQIRRESVFSRKHYFYPDLPKGYQISQFDLPICENGLLTFMLDGAPKTIRIRRIHIEEDAGKNTHADGINASYVDFNRAGTPLLEVVSEPDLHTPQEAMAAIKALRQLVTFLNICDGNMQEGSLRADINVSVRKKGDDQLGTRTETKNLNSFRYIGHAIAFETRRQIIELESGKSITQETRLWDPNAKESRSMRSKEEAHDYRYFPDPDLLPLVVSDELITSLGARIPERPYDKCMRYMNKFGLSNYDAEILTSERKLSEFYDDCISRHHNPKSIANWIINEVLRSSKNSSDTEEITEFNTKISSSNLAEIIKLIDEKIISNNIAKKVFAVLETNPEESPIKIIEENNWKVVSNSGEIESFVEQILRDNPTEVQKYRDGKKQVFGFLMGQLMKISKGQLDPETANKLLLAYLNKNS